MRALFFRSSRQAGIIIPLVIGVLAALLGFLAIVLLRSYATLLDAELQAAADTAAHSASASLCSSKACWDNVPSVIADTLHEMKAVGGSGGNALNLAGIAPIVNSTARTVTWDLTAARNLKITFERGRWLNPTDGFESYEGNWQDSHGAKPAFVVANAVRVTIERPRTWIPASIFPKNISRRKTAVSIAAPVNSRCVAPFAVPACALVNERGEFQGPALCLGDRYFARADHYCSNGRDCGSYPWQPYGPCVDQYSLDCRATLPNGVGPSALCTFDFAHPFVDSATFLPVGTVTEPGGIPSTVSQCNVINRFDYPSPLGWANQQMFTHTIDHYGVPGVPVSALPSGSPTDDAIEAAIIAKLNNSNTAPCFDAAIGDHFKIVSGGLTKPATDTAVWQNILGPGAQNPLLGGPIRPPDNDHPSYKSQFGTIEHLNGYSLIGAGTGTYQPDRISPGLCMEHRGRYGNYQIQGYVTSMTFELAPGISDDTPVWKVLIPVISSLTSNQSCEGVNASPSDPPLDPNDEFEIVGFLNATVYDVDVGHGVCNLVRARITCDNTFVPTSENTNPRRRPQIVK